MAENWEVNIADMESVSEKNKEEKITNMIKTQCVYVPTFYNEHNYHILMLFFLCMLYNVTNRRYQVE